jgi:hypothetical protein
MLRRMIVAAMGAMLMAAIAAAPAAAQDKPPLIVGAIYVGSVNDYGYNRSMKDGLEEMKLNIPGLKLIEAENVPETAESERVMEGMIQQGARLIFATSFGHQQFAFNLAKAHPDVYFEHAGGWMQAPNFGNFFGATQAAWYPMGVAAGKMTKSNTLGFVVGVPIGQSSGADPCRCYRRLVRHHQRERRRQRADRSGRRRRHHARRLAGDHHQGRRRPWRILHRLPVDRGPDAGAEGLAHWPRLHLGPVHDRNG